MGENKNINELDSFAKKYVREIKREQVSYDFTASLMEKIAEESKIRISNTSSLISKKSWFVIFSLIGLVLYFTFKSSNKSIFTIPEFNFSIFNNIEIPNLLDSVSVSSTTVYAFLFFGIMIAIQFVYLKNYFNKRFS